MLKFRRLILIIAVIMGLLQARGFAAEYAGLPLIRDLSETISEDQIWDIDQGPDGMMYFATNSSFLEYDGAELSTVFLSNQSAARSIAIHSSGEIFVGGMGEVGMIRRDPTGSLIYRKFGDPTGQLKGMRDVWRMWPTEKGFLAWCLDRILCRDGESLLSVPLHSNTFPTVLSDRLFLVDSEGDVVWVSDGALHQGAHLEGLDQGRVFVWMPQPDGSFLLGTKSGRLLRLEAEDLALALSDPKREIVLEPFQTEADAFLEKHQLYSGATLKNGDLALGTISGGLVILDQRGRLKYRIGENAGLREPSIWSVKEDLEGGLWLGTNRGVFRLSLEIPLTILGEREGLRGGVRSLARAEDHLWAATSLGLFRLDEDGFHHIESSPAPGWALVGVGAPGHESLLYAAQGGVFELRGERLLKIHQAPHSLVLQASEYSPGLVWVGDSDGLTAVRRKAGRWREIFPALNLNCEVRSIAEAADASLWLGTSTSGLIHIEFEKPEEMSGASITRLGEAEGLETKNNLTVFSYEGKLFAAGSSGLEVWDDSNERFVPSALFGPQNFNIGRVAEAGNGEFWVGRNLGPPVLVDVRGPSGTRVPRGLSFVPYPVTAFLPEQDSRCWIANGDGVYCFHGQAGELEQPAPSEERLALRRILIDGHAQPLEGPIHLQSPGSRLEIGWSLASYSHAVQEIYRYRLEGLDRTWSEWTARTDTAFQSLPGGDFSFLLQARDDEGKICASKKLELIVPRPWFLRWPAIIAWILIGLGLIRLGMFLRSRHLEREREQLEELVSERTRDLRRAIEEAQAASEAKGLFLAKMSHEIRTPLNGIIGALELALMGYLSPEQEKYLKIASSSAEVLLDLIGDVLDFSKIEAGIFEMRCRLFDLGRCINGSIQIVTGKRPKPEVEFDWEIDPEVPKEIYGDELRLRQILINLIGNAWKFTERGSVRVHVSRESIRDGRLMLHFVVRDTGIGIPEDQIPGLFDSFSQVDESYSRESEGSGLGLAISRRFVELMGGRIWVESELGQGSRFHFELPFGVEGAEVEAASARSVASPDAEREVSRPGNSRKSGEPGSISILVVDDNEVNRILTRQMLLQLGFRCDLASSGFEALETLDGSAYDVILLDLQMPQMDGFETFQRICDKFAGGPRPRVIALTAAATVRDRENCLRAGMDDYLTKPIKLEGLRTVLGGTGETPGARDGEPDIAEEEAEPAPFNTAPLQKIDAIDSSGEHRLLRKIFRSFEGSSVASLEKMGRRIEEEDWEELRKVAHGLKGSSLQLGAEELGALCRELEERALEGRHDETVRLFERITVSLEGVLSFLRNYEASLDGCAPESLSQGPDQSGETS